MPRARTGTLFGQGKDGTWIGRVTESLPDGSGTWRPLYSLGTSDEIAARAQLARLVGQIARGEPPSFDVVSEAPLFRDYYGPWCDQREASGVKMAKYERRYIEMHALARLGVMPLDQVRRGDIEAVLKELASKRYNPAHRRKRADLSQREPRPYRREMIAKVRATLYRLFDHACAAEIIPSNPAKHAKVHRRGK
jgi:hypothetical protein